MGRPEQVEQRRHGHRRTWYHRPHRRGGRRHRLHHRDRGRGLLRSRQLPLQPRLQPVRRPGLGERDRGRALRAAPRRRGLPLAPNRPRVHPDLDEQRRLLPRLLPRACRWDHQPHVALPAGSDPGALPWACPAPRFKARTATSPEAQSPTASSGGPPGGYWPPTPSRTSGSGPTPTSATSARARSSRAEHHPRVASHPRKRCRDRH